MIGVSIGGPLAGGFPKFINGHIQFIREKKIKTQPQMFFRRILNGRRNLGYSDPLCIGRGKAKKARQKEKSAYDSTDRQADRAL
jgi:hypothetical protein